MRAEVVGIGTELLLGDIVNTNASYIGQQLAAVGWACYRHTVVGDNIERIADVLQGAIERSDAVIVTGGLGPTQDDITREAVAHATGRALRRDDVIADSLRARFAAMGRSMPEMNLRQADVPDGARVIDATIGTAPGLIVEHGTCTLYLVPGVPREMRDMLERAVLPDLRRRGGAPIASRVVRTAGVAESAIAELLTPMWDEMHDVTMAFLAGGGEVRVRLTGTDAARLDEAVVKVRRELDRMVVGVDDETLESVVGRALTARGWTLSAAESLTGGALGARLTATPGASAYFRGSLVAYAVEAKIEALGVDPALLADVGTVDVAVAAQMAQGARSTFGSDVGVAVTGVAGPAEHSGRPPGSVALAVVSPLGTETRAVRFPGDRATVQQIAVTAALNLIRLHLADSATPAADRR